MIARAVQWGPMAAALLLITVAMSQPAFRRGQPASAKVAKSCRLIQSPAKRRLVFETALVPGQSTLPGTTTLRLAKGARRCIVTVRLTRVVHRAGIGDKAPLVPWLHLDVDEQRKTHHALRCVSRRGRCLRWQRCPTGQQRGGPRRKPYCIRLRYRTWFNGAFTTKARNVGSLKVGRSRTFRVTVQLDDAAPNAVMGAGTTFNVVWSARPMR